jgi:ribosomal protein S18 acetylase RimI-like enzyme
MKINDINIIPYREHYVEEVKNLLENIWGYNFATSFYRFKEGKIVNQQHQSAYLAFVNQDIVGMCSTWRNSFHPEVVYFGIHVHPSFRNMGIGEVLYKKVTEINTAGLPLQTSLWETSVSGTEFLRKHGFKEIRRTYEPKLQLRKELVSYIRV